VGSPDQGDLLLVFGSHLRIPLLLVEEDKLLEDSNIVLTLPVTLKQVILHLAPVPHLRVNVG
jgi:hypothetical protein